jgi:ribonuclease HI
MNIVYTDGACSGNPGPGGWAWVVPDGPYAAGAEAHTTNQRMEITAALRAVEAYDLGEIGGDDTADGAAPTGLTVVSDSTYVVNCFRDRWWEGWQKRGWVNSQRKPVANRDLWEPLIDLVNRRGDVGFQWVKGHGQDPWNDRADQLAVAAALSQSSARG